MLKHRFKKTYTRIDGGADSNSSAGNAADHDTRFPADLWRKCSHCGRPIYVEDVYANLNICPKCGGYLRVSAYRRIRQIADPGTFVEWDREMPVSNPLEFPGYDRKLAAAREKTGLNEAIVTGRARIGGYPAVLGVCDARFLMSSMGRNMGEKITRAVERATEEKLPVILFACSGGARMQEGMISLMQMAKTAAALGRHKDAGQLFISVLTDPTTGGVTASFAMLGDIILAEPGALIGFAGPRVIEQTIGQKLPEGFQRAEFLLKHGFVDRIVRREEMKETLAKILELHAGNRREKVLFGGLADTEHNAGDSGSPGVDRILYTKDGGSGECRGVRGQRMRACADEPGVHKPAAHESARRGGIQTERRSVLEHCRTFIRSAWESVQLSRKSDRPVASDYIHALFDDFIEFHGDRYHGDDAAVIGGIANFRGIPVTVIGQEKGKTTKDNIARNFGMPSPEGYRKALRLMKQAEAFGRPVICLVDTPGAFCGVEAEERGQGEAIARNLCEMSSLRVPVLSIVIGEGGSGGALAMAVANEVWMMEHAVYSILSPEGFASILWKDSKRAAEAASVMKITAGELLELGIIEQIVSEEEPASAETLPAITEDMRPMIADFLARWCELEAQEIVERRYERFRRY